MKPVLPVITNNKTAIFNGAKMKCPHCGLGNLYKKGLLMHDKCSHCNLVYLKNYGDPFFFQAIIDRGLFVFPIVASLFFGLHHYNHWLFIGFTVFITSVMLVTTRHRYGVCVALDYITRPGFPEYLSR